MTIKYSSVFAFFLISILCCNGANAESLEKDSARQQDADAAVQANNPLANMVAFNVQNYYIGELTESDENANQFWLRYAQPFAFYQLGGGTYLRTAPIWVYDFENDNYSVPLGLVSGT